MRGKRVEAVDRVAAAKEEALQFSTELVEALCARITDLDIYGESSHTELEVVRGEASALQERLDILGLRESELLAEFKVAQVEVARLLINLETSRADLEHL
ncbi:hypothetical protein ACLOJK_007023 [Asimina triloba]